MKQRICLIDDEKDIIDSFREVLSSDFEVAGFVDATEALKAIDAGLALDCVITDLRMPHLDGFGFLEQLKRKQMDPQIIVMSGNADKGDVVRVLNGGVHGFLEKPFTARQLKTQILELCARKPTDAAPAHAPLDHLKLMAHLNHLNQMYFDRIVMIENSCTQAGVPLFRGREENENFRKHVLREHEVSAQITRMRERLIIPRPVVTGSATPAKADPTGENS